MHGPVSLNFLERHTKLYSYGKRPCDFLGVNTFILF